MSWNVEYTDEFGEWWAGLTERHQEDVTAIVELLMALGPRLPFPSFLRDRGIAPQPHARAARAEQREAAASILASIRAAPPSC